VGFDPFNLEGLNRVFSVEMNRLQRGALSLLADEAERQRIMATELLKLCSDKKALDCVWQDTLQEKWIDL
jgi:hypothetical protein